MQNEEVLSTQLSSFTTCLLTRILGYCTQEFYRSQVVSLCGFKPGDLSER